MKTFKIKCMYCKSSFEVKLPAQFEDGKVACKSNMFKAKCIHCTKIFVVRLPIEDRTKLSPHFREMPIGLHHPRTRSKPLPPRPPLKPHLAKPEVAPLEVPAECITELEEPHEVLSAEPGPHAWGPHREDHEPTKHAREKKGFWTKPKLAAVLLVIVFFLGLANSITNVAYANDIVSSDARDLSDAGGVITISGTVIDFDTTVPIGDVSITILDTSQSTVTSPEGFYVLEDVPLGEHTIQASATGFQTVNKKVKLTLAPEKIIDFELQEGSGTIDVDESYSGSGGDIDDEDEGRSWNFIGMLTIIFSILALFGAYLAYTQNMFWACSTAAFFGILSFGFGIGAFLGVFALILILVSKDRFRGFNISEPAIDTST